MRRRTALAACRGPPTLCRSRSPRRPPLDYLHFRTTSRQTCASDSDSGWLFFNGANKMDGASLRIENGYKRTGRRTMCHHPRTDGSEGWEQGKRCNDAPKDAAYKHVPDSENRDRGERVADRPGRLSSESLSSCHIPIQPVWHGAVLLFLTHHPPPWMNPDRSHCPGIRVATAYAGLADKCNSPHIRALHITR